MLSKWDKFSEKTRWRKKTETILAVLREELNYTLYYDILPTAGFEVY